MIPRTPQDDGSVTRWIGDLKAGGDSAAQHLWERYFHRLVHLAWARLRAARRAGAIEDEEDAALSAFESFCRGTSEGRGLDCLAGQEPSPELAALVVDEYRRLRDSLKTEALRQVLDLRLEGHTREQIAQHLGCAERTVKRKLEVIREAWLQGES
jgi:hypothetical protein